MDDLTPRKIAGILVEKHDRFISEYSSDVERWERVNMLREKRDQLKHWVADDADAKYSRELDETGRELSEIEGAMKVSSKQQYDGIKTSVEDHVAARDYWLARLKELSA